MATIKRTGPLALTTALGTNIYNPPGPEIIRLIRVVNKGVSPATFSLWIGATGANAAGTELFSAVPVPVAGYVDWPFPIKLAATDFLVGGASLATTLTLILTTEQAAA